MSESESDNLTGHMNEVLQRTQADESPEHACLRSMMLEPENSTLWNALALVHMMNGDFSSAHDAIEKSMEIDTGNAWTWRIWGDLFRLTNDRTEAERAYRMSHELAPSNVVVMKELVKLYRRRGALEEEMLLLNKLVTISPNEQDLWDQLGSCLKALCAKWLKLPSK